MAKGRKLTGSRSERLLGSYSYGGQGPVTGGSELGEDEVWSMVINVDTGDHHQSNGSQSEWIRSHRRVPRGGLSLAFDESAKPMVVHQFRGGDSVAASPRGRHVASSAPLNVPDWSKIYRVDSAESLRDSDDGPDDEMVPPHEYLARSRTLVANSVYEGVGRTLKGRDLSRVRDAVWSQTGFDG